MKVSSFFKILLYLTATIDLINGFFINEIGILSISVGQIFRVIFIVLMTIVIFNNSKKEELIFLMFIIYYFIISIVARYYLNNNITIVVNDIMNFSKLLLIIMIIICGRVLIEKKILIKRDLINIIEFNSWIIVISLLVCKAFNLGSYAYLEDVGFKGYFYSNNELSIVLSLIFIYRWEEIYQGIMGKYKVHILKYISLLLIVASAFIIGAKTIYLVFAFTIIISVLRALIKMNIYSILKFLVCLSIVSIIFCLIGYVYRNEIQAIIIKQKSHLENRSLISFILSDRDILWKQLRDIFIVGNESVLKILFGFTPSFYNVELDFNVLYINYGIIGVMAIIIPLIKLLKISSKKYISIYPFIIYIAFALTAGHVIFAAFAGTFFSIHCLNMIEDKLTSEEGY